MIVDASALVAIVRREADAESYLLALDDAESPRISAATLFEAAQVIDGSGSEVMSRAFDQIVRLSGIEIVPFEAEHAAVARDARARFGKGSGHPAHLNFGDCMTYATAYIADEPLLYKGNDFSKTDIASAL